jgi:PilZ domain
LVNAPSALSLCANALYELVIGAGYDFPASTRPLTDREYFTARSDGSGEVSMKDKRRAPRRPMRCTAWIALAPGKLYGCVVADISDTGGRLDVEDAEAVPDTFMLWLASNGSAQRKCRVVWRQKRQVGVTFDRAVFNSEQAALVTAIALAR